MNTKTYGVFSQIPPGESEPGMDASSQPPSSPLRKGSLFSISDLSPSDVETMLLDLAGYPLLSATVSAISDLCKSDPEQLTDG